MTAEIGALDRGACLHPLRMTERGELRGLWGLAAVSRLPIHIAERMAVRSRELMTSYGLEGPKHVRSENGRGPGAGVFLCAEYENVRAGFSAIGERGKPAGRVAEEAWSRFIGYHATGEPVDPHLSDQIVLPVALADGRSEYRTARVTKHLLAHAYVIGRFFQASVEIDGSEGGPGCVLVDGSRFAA